jgi:dTMP kinase
MLIAFEGLHSAGKSTQVEALVRRLGADGVPVVRTSWNSSPPLGARIGQLKMKNRLGPLSMVLMEAADLAYRVESGLGEALASGVVVVADRWYHSTVVRAVSRGVDESYVRSCFGFAPEPDLLFQLGCTARETLNRRTAAGLPLVGHLIGEDVRPGIEPTDGYLLHQGEIAALYERVLPMGRIQLRCQQPPDVLHEQVVSAVYASLPLPRAV